MLIIHPSSNFIQTLKGKLSAEQVSLPLQVTIGENMKKLLSQIIKWLWDVLCKDWLCQKVYKLFICEILLPVLYSLLFNLSPLIFVVILMAFRENSVWFCIADSVKNGELFLVSLSFYLSQNIKGMCTCS